MNGIDTNVLVRIIVNDNQIQARKALKYVKKSEKIFISAVVLCEMVWVLQSCYDVGKAEIVDVIDYVLDTNEFVIEHLNAVRSALFDYTNGPADFSDYLLATIANHSGSNVTGTFDNKASTSLFFEFLG